MWDTLAHVLSSSSPLHGFLREAEAILTEFFTRTDREEERKREREKKRKKDHRERGKGVKGEKEKGS